MNRRITRRIADAVSEAFQIRVFELSPVKTPPVFPVPADPLELLSPLPGGVVDGVGVSAGSVGGVYEFVIT